MRVAPGNVAPGNVTLGDIASVRAAGMRIGGGEERLGGGQPDELHALLLGVLHLAHRAGHVRLVAAVEALHGDRALAHGGAHAVHRRIAAAHHDDALPGRVQRAAVEGGHVVAEALAVGRGQVVERRHDAVQPRAGAADVAVPVDAGGDQHRVVARAQFLERQLAFAGADALPEVEGDARRLEQPPAPEHHVLLQLEAGDAVDHQPADAVVAVVDVHRIAHPPQRVRRRQPARARADDAHGAPQLAARHGWLHPALVPGMIGDEALHLADGDALEILLDDAVALAQPVLRADSAADLGEGVGRRADLVRLLQPALRGELQPVGDVVVHRAVHGAERHAALRAARGLRAGVGGVEAAVDLGEILATLDSLALVGLVLLEADELQHAIGHGSPPEPAAGRDTGRGALFGIEFVSSTYPGPAGTPAPRAGPRQAPASGQDQARVTPSQTGNRDHTALSWPPARRRPRPWKPRPWQPCPRTPRPRAPRPRTQTWHAPCPLRAAQARPVLGRACAARERKQAAATVVLT